LAAGGYFRADDSGRDLRILCYDAPDGRIRWELREDKAPPNHITIKLIISIDPAGDVLVGGQTDEARPGVSKTVSKYTGIDGHLLWMARCAGNMKSSGIMIDSCEVWEVLSIKRTVRW